MKFKLIVVILTYNEEMHIARAIGNVIDWADRVIVLDSYSKDETTTIAKKMGAEVICRKFDNYKNQREYAIRYCQKISEWMFFLDADEYLFEELKKEINDVLFDLNFSGYYIPRRFIFMGKWIRYGGYYPTYLLRLFQPKKARIDREINEHVIVDGAVNYLKNDFVDHNLKNMEFWIDKHNKYTTREAEALLLSKRVATIDRKVRLFVRAERKEWVRQKVWNKLPILTKSPAYFFYRYFFRLGFLDGKEGLIFHFLQGFWFWFLVGSKFLEIKKNEEFFDK